VTLNKGARVKADEEIAVRTCAGDYFHKPVAPIS
jgi:hypothetical protein